MSFVQTVLLGALAGFTIYLGLPAGRLQLLSSRSRVALAMFSVGVLAFIFVDVLSNGISIVDDAMTAVKHHHQSVGYLIWLVVLNRVAVSFAYPFVGLGFVLTAFLAWALLGEGLTAYRALGTLLVTLGVVLIARGA